MSRVGWEHDEERPNPLAETVARAGLVQNKQGETLGHYHDQKKMTPSDVRPPSNGVMTREQLWEFARQTNLEAIHLAQTKNADYATGDDPFQNLRRGGLFGIAVRMDDKVSRLMNMCRPGHVTAVTDEGIEDTVRDLYNYSWLFLALHEDLRRRERR